MFEPSADARVMAKQLWDYYSALVDTGFHPDQAMDIILALVSN